MLLPVQAAVIERYGGNDVVQVREHPRPEVGPRDVLIEVVAAGVNPIDWKIRSGMAKAIIPLRLPVVLGSEASGIVAEVGAQVTELAPGDAVFVRVDKGRLGAFAEYLATDVSLVAPKPARLSHAEAACLPLAGLTAWQALFDVAHLEPGQRVLVHAAAGGVGSLAVQIAAHHGAHVVATASAGNHARVRQLGAETIIDHRTERFEDRAGPCDVVLDTVGGDTLRRSFQVLREGGTLVSIAAAVPDPYTLRQLGHPVLAAAAGIIHAGTFWRARRKGASFRYLFMHPDGKQLAALGQLADAGRLRATIDRIVPLPEIADAFSYSATGRAKGKIIVQVRPG